MANGVTLDTVSFNIESNASSAYKTINSLSASLRGLKDATAGGFKNLSTLSTSLETLSKSAASLSGVGKNLESIEGIVTQLGELQKVQSPKGLNSTINTLKKLKDETTDVGSALNNLSYISEVVPHINELSKIKTPTGLGYVNRALAELTNVAKDGAIGNIVNQLQKLPDAVEPLKALATIENPRGFNNAASSIAKLVDTFSKLNDPGVFENLTRVSNTLADALTPLANKMQQIGQGFSALQGLADKYGVSVTKIRERTKSSVSMFTRLGRALNTVGSAFKSVKKNTIDTTLKAIGKSTSSLYSKLKQLTLSLLGTRTLFTLTRKAVSEYMNMDVALSNQLDNLWRALGAQLAPAIEFVMYLFQQLVRVVYSVVKVLFGVDLIARANSKAMGSYADNTKKAVKELGNLAKFDDLNTIDFGNNDSSGNGSGVPQIDLKEIDLTPIQKIVDWMIKFKKAIEEALDTGKWYNVGKVLAEGFNEAVDFILAKIPKIREALFTVARDFGDFLNGVIETLDWGDIGKLITESLMLLPDTFTALFAKIHWERLGKGLNDLLENFDPVKVINSIGKTYLTLTKGISEALLQINFADVGKKIGDSVIAFFKNINNILKAIPWGELGKKVHEAIKNVDWKGLLDSIIELLKTRFASLGSLVAGALFGKTFKDESKAAIAGVATVLGVLLAKKLKSSLSKSLPGILEKVKGKFKKTKSTGKDITSTTDSLTDADSKPTLDLNGMFDDIGKATKAIAVLGGLALVINQLTGFIKAFGETGLSAHEGMALIASTMFSIAGAFTVMAGATKLLSPDSFLPLIAMFGGLSAVLFSLSAVLNSCAKLGNNLSAAFDGLNSVLTTLIVFMASLVVSAKILGSDPLALIAVLAITGSLSVILLTMKETLPTILDAVGKFINTIAPPLNRTLRTIGDIITDIINALGRTLPPIIKSVGGVFNTIFKGVERVINAVGNAITKIMRTADNSVNNVLNNILRFIRELGPAIEIFVNSAIRATTRLINFVVSGMEYLINSAIIKPLNKLINKLNKNAISEKLGWKINSMGTVSIDRFAPRLATGTNKIEYEGLYHLHPGESVVPKKYNPAIGGGTNEETNEKLDTLIDIMNNMSFTNVVNIGNETVYKKQQEYNKKQYNKYGTINLY